MKLRKIIASFITIALVLSVFLQPLHAYSLQGGSGGSGTDGSGSGQHGSGGSGSGKGGSGGTGGSGEHETEDGVTHEGTGGSGESGSGSGSGGASGSGGSGSGRGGAGGGKPTITNGAVTLDVYVEWPKDEIIPYHPEEVYVTLIGADSSDTVRTDNGVATFYTEPGDEWKVRGEAIPGYIIPEENVAIKGTDEFVEATLIYEVGYTNVTSIELNKSALTIFDGDSVQLSANVLPANAIQEVVWSSDNDDVATVVDGVVTGVEPGQAIITATGSGGVTNTCDVIVKSLDGVIRVSGVTSNVSQVTLTIPSDKEYNLEETISPVGATIKDVIWISGDRSVATVDQNGLVTAVSPGSTVITVETIDGGFKAYTRVVVVLEAEIEYIYPTLENEEVTEHFDDIEKIYINVRNLVEKLLTEGMTDEGIKYYIKVMEKGDTDPLGIGEVIILSDTIEFCLYDFVEFDMTDNNSSRYFVYMSKYDDFPKDDEQTLMTNFMGGTATPTIPVSDITVNLKIYGNSSPDGIIFLLAREEVEGKTVDQITWRDFYVDGEANSPVNPYHDDGTAKVGEGHFVDEVKMVGKTDTDGDVVWFEPRETIKLGGYLLLEVTPLGYEDNLSDRNPDSDDGELMKQVHLMRDGSIDVKVINTYVGVGPNAPGEPNVPDIPSIPNIPNVPTVPDVPVSDNDSSDNDKTEASSSKISTIGTDQLVQEDTLVTLMEVEKFSGHWAKKSIDNIVLKGMLRKSVFNIDVDLNEKISKGYIIDFIQSISMKEKREKELDIDYSNQVTREEAAVLVMKAFEFEPLKDAVLTFVDSDEIDVVTKGYIAKAVELRVITGYPDNTYRPKTTITRAELFTMISRCLDIK